MYEIILASQSPRRRHILTERGFRFRTHPIEVSEILDKNLNLFDQISACAQQKAEAAVQELKSLNLQDKIILAADTVVIQDGEVLGKPKNSQDARQTLRRLSGKTHQVVTGFCLWNSNEKCFILGHEISEVEFRDLSDQEISEYVASGDPMDKAGAYGIQGEAKKFVKRQTGSFKNIVGLPIERIEKEMAERGWIIAREP